VTGEQMTFEDEARFAKRNRALAEEKIREEIRNAVRAEIMRDGLSRSAIEKAARETLASMVDQRVRAALRDNVIQNKLQATIDAAIKEAFGGQDVSKTIKNLLVEQARVAAAKFVEERVSIDVRGDDFGSF